MGQEPGAGSTQMTETRDPEQIRQEIEATRRELGDTVEALAAKADVKAQAREKVAHAKDSVVHKKDDLLGKAKEVSPDTATSAAGQLSAKVRENPLPVAALGAFAAGFLAGRISGR